MTDIEIRRGILKMAYERFKEHPYHRITPKELENALNIGFKELNYNIIYLEEKGFIELQKPYDYRKLTESYEKAPRTNKAQGDRYRRPIPP